VLPVGQATDWDEPGPSAQPDGAELVTDCFLRIVPGPRDDWFAPSALDTLTSAAWRVSAVSNRVGTRLEGPALARARHDELLSEGVVTGSIQVPPAGRPILLGPDHPTTGGYPVLAVVVAGDLSQAGQLAPGATVQFSIVTSVPIGV
jgi:allophanate hydrolase subunit 2